MDGAREGRGCSAERGEIPVSKHKYKGERIPDSRAAHLCTAAVDPCKDKGLRGVAVLLLIYTEGRCGGLAIRTTSCCR